MTPDEAAAEIDNLRNVLLAIHKDLESAVLNVIATLVPPAHDIIKFVHDRIGDIFNELTTIGNALRHQVTTAIGALLPSAVDFLVGIGNDIFRDVHDILGNLATAEEFVAGAIGEIAKHAQPFENLLTSALGGGLLGGLTGLLQFMEGESPDVVDHFLDEALKSIPRGHWLHSMIGGLRGRHAPWMALVLPLLVGVLLQPIGEAMAAPFLVELKQDANKLVPNLIASPPELVEQRLRNVIGVEQFHLDMAKNGIDVAHADQMLEGRYARLTPEQINTLRFRGKIGAPADYDEALQAGLSGTRLDMAMEAQRPILDVDVIRQIFLRGYIDRPKHDELMALHGFTPDAIDRMVRLYYIIPSPQDLIHMGIRNVFDPQIVEKFQLSADAPDDFFKAAAQQGISQDWALKYWQAHWVVPGTDQAFTMFQRVVDKSDDPNAETYTLLDGTQVQTIIGKPTLRLFLKDKDTPPYYRDKLTQIAYHPLNRIDVRRMYSVGSLSKAGVERAYLNLGYAPDNARLLADFVERYYAQSKKDKAQPLIDGLRREILRLFEQGKLDEKAASAALSELNFSADEASMFFAETKLVQQASDASQMEQGIGRLFIRQFISEQEARTRLAKRGIPDTAIDRLIARWQVTVELNQDTEHFHKARDLTKSEVITAYQDGAMTRDVAESYLELLGYPKPEADILLAVADYNRDKATRVATQDALKALMVNGIRDASTTSNALDALGIPADRRDALLSEWTLLRETRTEKIPIATLRDMLKAQALSEEETFAHLKRHRFTDDDANLIIGFWLGQPTKRGGIIGKITGG